MDIEKKNRNTFVFFHFFSFIFFHFFFRSFSFFFSFILISNVRLWINSYVSWAVISVWSFALSQQKKKKVDLPKYFFFLVHDSAAWPKRLRKFSMIFYYEISNDSNHGKFSNFVLKFGLHHFYGILQRLYEKNSWFFHFLYPLHMKKRLRKFSIDHET